MGKKAAYFDEAEDLYVVDGLTLEAVAARLPVSVTTLSNWKQDGEWEERRRELGRALADVKRNTLLLRQRLVEKALKSLSAQDVYAYSHLESAMARARGSQAGTPAPLAVDVREIKTPQDAVDVLNEVVQRKLNGLLTQPELLTLAGIKDLKQCLELIDNLKAKYQPDEKTGQAPGLSDEAANEIRRQILGIADPVQGSKFKVQS
jgi:hypothetical protein